MSSSEAVSVPTEVKLPSDGQPIRASTAMDSQSGKKSSDIQPIRVEDSDSVQPIRAEGKPEC